jgi:muconolactone delta-isomerase
MLFLVELDHVKSGITPTGESSRMFIEQVIFPTLARGEQLIAEKKIVAGGPAAGCIALRLMVEADSAEEVDRIISSLPLWTVAETRVTPLITFAERREHVQSLLNGITAEKPEMKRSEKGE